VKRLALQTKKTAVCSDPQPSGAILEQHANEGIGEPLCRTECAEGALPVSDQSAAIRPGPERSVASRQQRIDAVVAEGGLVAGVEHDEPHAVEARQASARADPEIAIRGLRKRLREIFWQALGALPDAAAVKIRPWIGRARLGSGV
jgi:hypothetical protein